MKKIIILCFILALAIRVYSVFPYNTIIGFDQARDLFDAHTMIKTHHLRVIGPTAGNDPSLHHGIAFVYYLALPLLFFGPNPMSAVYFNIFIQSFLVFILAYFSWELFKNKHAVIITSIMTAFSYNLTQFAGWLSNPTVTLVTVPLFYLSLWKYQKNKWWILGIAFFLGISIEFELFFVYLIPVLIIYILLFRPSLPSLKQFGLSVLLFVISVSSMIATELKYSFSGVKDLLSAGSNVGGNLPFWGRIHFFSAKLSDQFSLTIAPLFPSILAVVLCIFLITRLRDEKKRSALGFLYIYVASPAIMLFLGVHNAPWFLIGLPPAILILYGYIFSRAKKIGYLIVIIIAVISFSRTSQGITKGQQLLEPDKSSVLRKQLRTIRYTYMQSNGAPFAIDTVTNPLYINATWGYQYMWYGPQTYNYLPHWAGGDQLPPYNTIPKTDGSEQYYYVIVDSTPRIPQMYKDNAVKHAAAFGDFVEKVDFDGVEIYKFQKKTNG